MPADLVHVMKSQTCAKDSDENSQGHDRAVGVENRAVFLSLRARRVLHRVYSIMRISALRSLSISDRADILTTKPDRSNSVITRLTVSIESPT